MPQSERKPSGFNHLRLVVLFFVVLFFGIVTVNNFIKNYRNSQNSFTVTKDIPVIQEENGKINAVGVKINNTEVTVEVANTDALRREGLSYRENLDANSGMLFIFDTTQMPFFWMKDMKIPLDIIWINENTIVDIDENVPFPEKNTPLNQLPKYSPKEKVNYVLEVNAGFCKENGIEMGDTVTISDWTN